MTLALLLLAGCAPTDPDEGPVGLLATDAGLYEVLLTPSPDPFEAGVDVVLGIALHEAGVTDGLPGAAIEVTPWMPDMGHGIADPPVVSDRGDGAYEAAFVFTMAGAWELALAVDAEAGADTLTVTYEVR